MPISITSKLGDLDVIGSGSVISYSGRALDIFVGNTDAPDELPLRIEFRFVSIDGEAPSTKYIAQSNSHLIVTLTNWHSRWGIGNSEPAIIGDILGRRLYLALANYIIGDKEPLNIIYYTFYLGEQIG